MDVLLPCLITQREAQLDKLLNHGLVDLGEDSPERVDFQRVRMLKGEGVALTIDDASGTRPTMGLCQTWELLGITLL